MADERAEAAVDEIVSDLRGRKLRRRDAGRDLRHLVTHFADDETIAELERQARRIAELETALAAIHATSRRVTHHHEWYLDGVRQSPGVYVVMRVGDAPDAPVRRQPLRVIVCGGRDFADSEHVWRVLGDLDDEYGISAVAHGGAAGADSEAGKWATAMRKSVQVYHARWKQEGKAAGPLRNQRMLDQFKPDAVVAFPGGRGTADMVWRAVESGVRVVKACTSSDLPAEDAEAKAQRIRGAETMQHDCRYYATIMSGPVIRFGFGYDEGMQKEAFSSELRRQWSAEISASRDGVSLQGRFPIYGSSESVEHIKHMLDWAWDAHLTIGKRGDHDAAKEWVRVHNASLVDLRQIAAEKLGTGE